MYRERGKMSHLHSENTSFHHIFTKNIQKKDISIQTNTQSHTSPNAKSRKKGPRDDIYALYPYPYPTLSYPHPGIHIHIHTSSHPPITPSLTHPNNILDIGICPPIQEQPHNISTSITCCPIDRSHSTLCISIDTRTGEGRDRWREEGERRGRDGSGMCE